MKKTEIIIFGKTFKRPKLVIPLLVLFVIYEFIKALIANDYSSRGIAALVSFIFLALRLYPARNFYNFQLDIKIFDFLVRDIMILFSPLFVIANQINIWSGSTMNPTQIAFIPVIIVLLVYTNIFGEFQLFQKS